MTFTGTGPRCRWLARRKGVRLRTDLRRPDYRRRQGRSPGPSPPVTGHPGRAPFGRIPTAGSWPREHRWLRPDRLETDLSPASDPSEVRQTLSASWTSEPHLGVVAIGFPASSREALGSAWHPGIPRTCQDPGRRAKALPNKECARAPRDVGSEDRTVDRPAPASGLRFSRAGRSDAGEARKKQSMASARRVISGRGASH